MYAPWGSAPGSGGTSAPPTLSGSRSTGGGGPLRTAASSHRPLRSAEDFIVISPPFCSFTRVDCDSRGKKLETRFDL